MHWLIPALLAPAFYTLVNFFDKYLVVKVLADYRGLPIFTGLAALIAGYVFMIISGFSIPPAGDIVLILISGCLMLFGLASYYQALTIAETTEVIILMKMIPLFTLILSLIFLGQTLNLSQLIGFLLILVGTLLISLQKNTTNFKVSKTFYLMALSSFLFASAYVIFAYVSREVTFQQSVAFESWGVFLGSMILAAFSSGTRQGFLMSLKSLNYQRLSIIFLNEGMFVVAKYFTFLAVSLGPVALVSVLEGMQLFYGLILGIVLTLLIPKVFQESVGRSAFFRKVAISSLIFLGIYLSV